MIYVPYENVSDYACYVVYDKDTIRAYIQTPQVSSTSNFVDYYVNSHYLHRSGSQTWGNYNPNLPTCLSTSELTNDFYYRNDLPDILISFMILAIICIWLPYKIFSRAFGRWLKL